MLGAAAQAAPTDVGGPLLGFGRSLEAPNQHSANLQPAAPSKSQTAHTDDPGLLELVLYCEPAGRPQSKKNPIITPHRLQPGTLRNGRRGVQAREGLLQGGRQADSRGRAARQGRMETKPRAALGHGLISNQTDIQAAIEKLAALEKQTRQVSSTPSLPAGPPRHLTSVAPGFRSGLNITNPRQHRHHLPKCRRLEPPQRPDPGALQEAWPA